MRTAKQLYHYLLFEGHDRPITSILPLALEVLREYLPPDWQPDGDNYGAVSFSGLLFCCDRDVAYSMPANSFSGGDFRVHAYLCSGGSIYDSSMPRTMFTWIRHDRTRDVCFGVTPLPVVLRCLDMYRRKFCKLRQAFARYLERRFP